jgi:hypothetical protein
MLTTAVLHIACMTQLDSLTKLIMLCPTLWVVAVLHHILLLSNGSASSLVK